MRYLPPSALLLTLLCSSLSLTAQTTDSVKYIVRPLGSINSGALDYAPSFTPDGRRLYFASTRTDSRTHTVWYADRVDDSTFSAPRQMGSSVNRFLRNQGCLAIGADGVTAYLTGCSRPDGVGDCDIYKGTLTGEELGGTVNLASVNSPRWETQPAITGDGRLLFFVSNRGGEDQRDIYVSALTDTGWSTPLRFGAPINTGFAEESPSSVGMRIYFASNRPGGFGGYDLYYTERAGGKWGAPVNLGPDINTEADERSMSVTLNGDVVFARFSGGDADIHLATLLPTGGR